MDPVERANSDAPRRDDGDATVGLERREFLQQSARRLVYVAPLIEVFRARPLLAQTSTAGSAGFSGAGGG